MGPVVGLITSSWTGWLGGTPWTTVVVASLWTMVVVTRWKLEGAVLLRMAGVGLPLTTDVVISWSRPWPTDVLSTFAATSGADVLLTFAAPS